jgi:multidrug efflux pump subunit AcrA (membrane-fusion protein)
MGAMCVAAIVAAVLVVGPAPASSSSVTRTSTVARGVVQSTVSGSGNLEPISQLDLGFKTSGTVTSIDVKQGQGVGQGQLIATLDPQSAEVTLEQAKAALESAEASLAREEETGGESSSAQTSPSSSGNSGGASAKSAAAGSTPAAGTETPAVSPTTPAQRAPVSESASKASKTESGTTPAKRTRSAETTAGSDASSTTTTSTTTALSTATREANLASARASVKSDRLTVQSDEQAVQDTRLTAPESGTIASLSGQVGEVVSGSGTTRVSAGASSSSSSSSTGAGTTGAGRSTAAASSGSGSTGSSSASFAVLTDLSAMQLVVPLSESEVGSVRAGQPATVTVEALSGRKFAAHVSEVAILSTSNSGVVSYDVTFRLDQMEAGLRPGMSASAEVVIKQAEGVNVPTSAISAGTVTVVRGGKHVRQAVTTGLAGNSSTIILSGLQAGETIVLPSSSSTTTSGRSSLGSRIGALGGVGLGGAGGGGFGGPGGAGVFLRGGG